MAKLLQRPAGDPDQTQTSVSGPGGAGGWSPKTWPFVALAFIFLLPRSFYGDVRSGLDPSWEIALHLAHDAGFVFGRDFAFTYGPLGFLSARLPFESIRWHLILADLLLWATILYCLLDLCSRARTTAGRAAIALATLSVTRTFYSHDLVIVYFCLFLFLLLKYDECPRLAYLSLAALFSTLTLYVKLNMSLIAAPCVLAVLAMHAIRTRGYRRGALLALLYVFGLLGSSALVSVDLLGYLEISTHIISSYNAAQFLAPEDGWHFVSMAVVIIGAFGFASWRHRGELRQAPSFALMVLFVGGFLFVLFKQAFLRADGHIFIFFNYVTIPLGMLCLFSGGRYRRALTGVVGLSLLLSFRDAETSFTPTHLRAKFAGLETYVQEASLSGEEIAERRKNNGIHLPPEILRYVRSGTVDVIPWETSYILRHQLDYNPRPIMHSYIVSDAFLDRKNYEKYVSPTAPDWVLYTYDCIDGRWCFGDEALTKIGMLQVYEPVLKKDGLLLLGKRSQRRTTVRSELRAGEVSIGEDIEISRSSQLQYIHLTVRYSPLGWLRSVFFQPPELRLRVETENGKVFTYRAIKTQLDGGFLANYVVRNTSQARKFFDGDFDKLRAVKRLRLYSEQSWGFRRDVSFWLEAIALS